MAKKQQLVQSDLLELQSLDNPDSGFLAVGAKSDGLYIKKRDGSEKKLVDSTEISAFITSVNGISPVHGDVKLTPTNIGAEDKLISGANIKTINGESILGTGNLEITSGGGSTIQTISVNELSDLDNLNLSENLYIVKGGVKGQLIVVDDEAIVYTAELSGFVCEKAVEQFSGELGSFTCVKSLPLNLITASFETHVVTVHSSHPVASDVTVGVEINAIPSMFYITIPIGSSSNVVDTEVPVTSVKVFSVTPEFDSEYDYYFATLK